MATLSLDELLKLESAVQLQLLQSTAALQSNPAAFSHLSQSMGSSLERIESSLKSHRSALRAGDHVGLERLSVLQARVASLSTTLRLQRSSHSAATSRRALLSSSSSSSSSSSGAAADRSLSLDAQASADAAEVTRSLLRTRSALSAELSRISSVASQIATDGDELKDTMDTFVDITDVAGRAKKVLRSLKNREVRERVALFASAALFYCVVAYCVWTRLRIPFLLW